MSRTVRQATFDVLRELGGQTLYANPGSTEVAFLKGLPDDFNFVLGLHEGAVVGMATGRALATGDPSTVLLHTTAGLGNAVGALATAAVNRAPMVVIVGQQDRRHLLDDPFLTGHLAGLAGTYPVSVDEPHAAADVPSAVARAWHLANLERGPALVVVPMGDWDEPWDERVLSAPRELHVAARTGSDGLAQLATLLDRSDSPAVVAGAHADSREGWDALVALAERLQCPVYAEAFGPRAGFPQDHRLFAGHLPSNRESLRQRLRVHDVVLVVGTFAFRQNRYQPGGFVDKGTTVAVVTDVSGEAIRSAADLVVCAAVPETIRAVAERLVARSPNDGPGSEAGPRTRPETYRHGRLTPQDVFDSLAVAVPAESVLLEETPSSRNELLDTVRIRRPGGFASAAMGGLGFALPAAVGFRMGDPHRPVVAVIGDGSSLYQIQGLWSAVHYQVGVLYVVMRNGGYRVLDHIAAQQGSPKTAWPLFEELSITEIAHGFGCAVASVATRDELEAALTRIAPTLATMSQPLLIEAVVDAEPRISGESAP